jgi:putative transposase
MKNFKAYYKRNLPHYQPIGYTYFVTYRLSGSLPVELIKKLKSEREKQRKEIAGISDKSLQQEKYKKM